jgi:hypothetical protein
VESFASEQELFIPHKTKTMQKTRARRPHEFLRIDRPLLREEHGSKAILSGRNGRKLQLLKINNLSDRFLGALNSEAILINGKDGFVPLKSAGFAITSRCGLK